MLKAKQTELQAESGNMFTAFIRCLRPKQWTKNILVFAAFMFSINKIDPHSFVETITRQFAQSLAGFVLFCLTSGVVYIMNDYADINQDRQHPVKKHRPMASGAIHPNVALIGGLTVLIVCMVCAFAINVPFALLLIVYFIVNIAYSFHLKHVVIIDVMIVASGFVMRAIGGALIINVPFTPWFLVCTLLLALFLAISKRRHEFMLLEKNKGSHRKVLEHYSSQLLDQFISIVTTATVMSYALFTFTSENTINLMWTIPFVLYGIFRYLYLIYMQDEGGSPEKLLLQDKHILITVLLYALSVFIILRYF